MCDGTQNLPRWDAAENDAWKNWCDEKLSPKKIMGEGLMAAASWQCVAAINAIATRRFASAIVSTVGCNQQAIGARFSRSTDVSSDCGL
ncbi:MAG: hypothetical protein ABJC04_11070 [Verrucomicrobiota bacterium]